MRQPQREIDAVRIVEEAAATAVYSACSDTHDFIRRRRQRRSIPGVEVTRARRCRRHRLVGSYVYGMHYAVYI